MRLRSTVPLVAAGAVGALLVMAASSPAVHDWLLARETPSALLPAARSAALPALSRADVALVRARTLYARGRLAEALQALDRVEPGSSASPLADELRIEIQQLLLSTRPSTRVSSAPRAPAGQP